MMNVAAVAILIGAPLLMLLKLIGHFVSIARRANDTKYIIYM